MELLGILLWVHSLDVAFTVYLQVLHFFLFFSQFCFLPTVSHFEIFFFLSQCLRMRNDLLECRHLRVKLHQLLLTSSYKEGNCHQDWSGPQLHFH